MHAKGRSRCKTPFHCFRLQPGGCLAYSFKNSHDPFIPVPFWPLLSGDKIDLTTYYPTKASSRDSGAGIQKFVHFTLYAINSLMFIKSGKPLGMPNKTVQLQYIIQTDGTEYVDIQHSHLYHQDSMVPNQDSKHFFFDFFWGSCEKKHHPPPPFVWHMQCAGPPTLAGSFGAFGSAFERVEPSCVEGLGLEP